MGYRSEVALTLKKEDGLELIRQAKENEPVRNLMSCANIIDQNEFITFHWISVMWDGSYERVRFITRFYQNLEKYSFKRIGDTTTILKKSGTAMTILLDIKLR